jgi:hypothetical protein
MLSMYDVSLLEREPGTSFAPCLQETEGPHYADFFDAPHEGVEVRNLQAESKAESEEHWMEVGENNEDATDEMSDVSEELNTKKVR